MSKEQTALKRIKDEVAKEQFPELGNWYRLDPDEESVCWPIVNERYALECCQATLEDLKSKIREAMKPEIVKGERIHRESDFLFACDEILKLINSIK